MHEKYKLAEAEHFLSGMRREHQQGYALGFGYELSGFISAARSVLLYALKEAGQKGPIGKNWYKSQFASDSLLGYMRDKRDLSIHSAPRYGPIISEPVKPAAKYTTRKTNMLIVEEDDGERTYIPGEHYTTDTHYEFPDRPGEDVLDLAYCYLELLKKIVEDGITKGHITG